MTRVMVFIKTIAALGLCFYAVSVGKIDAAFVSLIAVLVSAAAAEKIIGKSLEK